MEPHKVNLIGILQLLASVEEQDRYQEGCPQINVKIELVNQWFDDFYMPEESWFVELFDNEQIDTLNRFSSFFEGKLDQLPDEYSELRKSSAWKEVVREANHALDKLGWRNVHAAYD